MTPAGRYGQVITVNRYLSTDNRQLLPHIVKLPYCHIVILLSAARPTAYFLSSSPPSTSAIFARICSSDRPIRFSSPA